MGAIFIFFSCSKDDSLVPLSQNDQSTTLKSKKVKTTFTGTEIPVSTDDPGEVTVLPNGKTLVMGNIVTWQDISEDEPRVAGITVWTANWLWNGKPMVSDGKYWGKGEMTVDNDLGTWEISFHGNITLIEGGGFIAVAYCVGAGKSGAVKGLVAHWIDTLDTSLGFYYTTKGYIVDKNHHWRGHH